MKVLNLKHWPRLCAAVLLAAPVAQAQNLSAPQAPTPQITGATYSLRRTKAPRPLLAAAPAPTATPVAPNAAPAPAATPALQSPITSPNTDAPDIAPSPQLPLENQPADIDPAAQNPQFQNPNQVLPAPPLDAVGVPAPGTQIESNTPNGPPVVPAPTPLPTPPEGEIQSGDEGENGDFLVDAPGGLITQGNLTLSRSPVTLRYREFTAKGDRALIDRNSNLATLAGNLTITARGQVFTGKSLVFNLETGKWTLSSLETEFPPEFFPPGSVLSPLYVRNGTVNGEGDIFGGQDFRFTSCDRDHYYIQSQRLEFYRNKNGDPSRLVLRRNAVYVFGRKLLPLPVYVISLLGSDTRRQPLQSTFGQNATDGYFVRSLYDLRATPRVSESLLLDALQKRGFGLGFQRQYAATAGILYLYGLNGKNGEREINTRVDRTYRLTELITSNIRIDSAQITSPSGLSTAGTAQTTTTRNGQFTFSRQGEQARTNATFGFNNSSYGFGASKNGSILLDHRQNFGDGFALEATSALSRSQTGASAGFAGSDAATNDNSFVLSKNASPFDAFLRADLHRDLVQHKTYSLERLPELTLQSSTARLPIPGLKQLLPGNFSLALGKFNEPSSQQQKERADFFYTPDNKDFRLLGGGKSQSRLGFSGTFEQAFYSDNTARYNTSYNLVSNSTAGPAGFQVNYSKQSTQGFTPFQFDFFTPGETLDYNFSLQRGQKFRLNLTGGRDIQNGYTRDAIFRVQFAPTPRIYTSLGTSYRLQPDQPGATPVSRFGDVYANLRLNRNRNRFAGGAIALGVRYSPQTSQITQANGSVDVNLGAKTRIQGLAGYDGFSKKFDFTQLRVTRDLHCFNLYTTYDGQRKELRFDLAIKAFPFADTRFGRNDNQEGFDSSVGDIQ